MTENLRIAARTLSRGATGAIKVACLGVGLLAGLLLVAKVVFELSYDNFYTDADRVFVVRSNVARGDGGTSSFFQTAGSVAGGLSAEVAGIEAATRMIDRGASTLKTADGQSVEGRQILSDRHLFRVLDRPVVAGAGSEALAVPANMLVSRSMAERLGTDALGAAVSIDGEPYTVAGIYEDLPRNTRQPRYDIITSLEHIEFANSWYSGNSAFSTYVRLGAGVVAEDLTAPIRTMQAAHRDVEADRARGSDLRYTLYPLRKVYADKPDVRRSVLILSILAVVVLVGAVMNYVLVDIASVAGRARGIATRRCYGAQRTDIAGLALSEALLHVGLAVGLAAVLATGLADFIGRTLEVPVVSLVSLPQSLAVMGGICAVIFAIAVAVPTGMFMNVPVSSVFRASRRGGRVWKLSMLAGQFAVSAFIVVFLICVQRQYSMMTGTDPGYDYAELLRISVHRVGSDVEKNRLVEELRRLPQVSGAALTDGLPYNRSGLGGNNVSLEGVEDRINIFDFGVASADFPEVMGMRMAEGAGFTAASADESSVVSRSLAERIMALTGWESVVGRTMSVPLHGESTIVGVYDNVLVGDMVSMDARPSAVFLFTDPERPGEMGVRDVVVRLHDFSAENVAAVRAALPAILPGAELEAHLMRDDMADKYAATRRFRSSVVAACLILLLITAAGLVGFVYNEINRRSAEIAVRRIHGATAGAILRLLGTDVGRIALAAIVPGAVGAHLAADRWMQNFAERAEQPAAVLAGGSALLLAAIVALVVLNSLRVARRNPVESLNNN